MSNFTAEQLRNIVQAQEAFLLETVEWYALNPRGLSPDGFCSYSAGCAIGRKLDAKLRRKLDEQPGMKGVTHPAVFCFLPEFLQRLGKDFLATVQSFHDANGYWVPVGRGNELSYSGKFMHQKILEKIKAGRYLQDL